jgi:hypothetical protein
MNCLHTVHKWTHDEVGSGKILYSTGITGLYKHGGGGMQLT